MVDISGTQLTIGDKVAVQYQQLFRIGQIVGFTAKKIKVAFDFSANGDSSLESASIDIVALNPWRVAKVINQNIGLTDYYQYIKI